MTDTDDQIARSFTDDRLASDLLRLADDIRFDNADARAARLREAARRLNVKRPNPQFIATLADGSQIAYMHGNVFTRSNVGYSWPTPLPEDTRPHQPGTWYRGEW